MHARVAQGIETLHTDEADEVAALAAYHWEKAQNNMAAAAAFCRAALHVGKGNRTQGMEYIRKALLLTDNEPPSETRAQVRLQALAELIVRGSWRFDMSEDELDTLSAEAQALAEGAGLTDLAVLLRAGHSAALGMMRGDIKRWSIIISDIVSNMEAVSTEVQAALKVNHAYCRYTEGEFEAGLQQVIDAAEMANGDVNYGMISGYSALVTAQNEIVLHSAALGQFELALQTNQQGQAHALANGLTEELVWHLSNQNEALLFIGHKPDHPLILEAASNAVKAHDLAEQVASDYTRGVAKRCLAISLFLTQQYELAEAAFKECLNHFRQQRAHLEVEAHCLALLATTQLYLGNENAALVSAQIAIDRSQAQGAAFFECLAHIAQARCLLSIDAKQHATAIHQALDHAAALVEKTAGRSQTPVIIELHGRLAGLLGDAAQSADKLQEALKAYRAIQADGHVSRLEQELSDAA